MRKVILYIAVSIDNYIAKPDGDTSWLHNTEYVIENEDFGYGEFMINTDAAFIDNDIPGFINSLKNLDGKGI